MTSFCVFKFMALYSIIQYLSVTLLYSVSLWPFWGRQEGSFHSMDLGTFPERCACPGGGGLQEPRSVQCAQGTRVCRGAKQVQ